MMQNATPPGELVHYGVKGMHWGVRKNTPTNSGYGANQQKTDKKNLGRGGVKRINRRMNKGATLDVARKQERSRRAKIRAGVSLGVLFAPEIAVGAHAANNVLKNSASVLAQKVAVKAETNRGRASAAATMGLPRQASTGPNYSKKNRGGAYNITSV